MLLPGDEIEDIMWFPGEDKILHFGSFAFWSFLVTLAIQKIQRNSLQWIVIGAAFLYGGGIEIMQSFVPGRSTDIYDMVMNVSGAIAGYFMADYAKKELIRVDKKFD